MELTVGGSKTVVPRISGGLIAGAAGAGVASVAAVRVAAELSACGAGWLSAAGAWFCCGVVQPAANSSAPMTTAVRRKGNKCLLDIEISVQISETAIPGFGLQINHVSLYRVLLSRPPSNDCEIVEDGF